MADKKEVVTEARIIPPNKEEDRCQAEIQARFNERKDWELVFSYYNNEICFGSSEFIGKTKEECIEHFHKKDIAYTRGMEVSILPPNL